MQRGIVVMPTAILTACGELGKSGHRNKDIRATIINISERDSRQGHIVVAESLSVSTNGVKVGVSHGFLGSQAFLKKQVSQVRDWKRGLNIRHGHIAEACQGSQ